MNTELRKHVESFDNGEEVKTVIMGGICDGYEMAIQELAIETMRILMLISIPEKQEDFSSAVSLASDSAIDMLDKKHGFSGAQVGASKNLSAIYWKQTPSGALAKMKDEDRIITISKTANGGIKLSKKIGD
jgi:hypothetical protein